MNEEIISILEAASAQGREGGGRSGSVTTPETGPSTPGDVNSEVEHDSGDNHMSRPEALAREGLCRDARDHHICGSLNITY